MAGVLLGIISLSFLRLSWNEHRIRKLAGIEETMVTSYTERKSGVCKRVAHDMRLL
jgi:hypothetical protein